MAAAAKRKAMAKAVMAASGGASKQVVATVPDDLKRLRSPNLLSTPSTSTPANRAPSVTTLATMSSNGSIEEALEESVRRLNLDVEEAPAAPMESSGPDPEQLETQIEADAAAAEETYIPATQDDIPATQEDPILEEIPVPPPAADKEPTPAEELAKRLQDLAARISSGKASAEGIQKALLRPSSIDFEELFQSMQTASSMPPPPVPAKAFAKPALPDLSLEARATRTADSYFASPFPTPREDPEESKPQGVQQAEKVTAETPAEIATQSVQQQQIQGTGVPSQQSVQEQQQPTKTPAEVATQSAVQQQQIQATTGVPSQQSVLTPMETQEAQGPADLQQQQIQPGTGVPPQQSVQQQQQIQATSGVPAQSVPTPTETQQLQQQQIQPGTEVPQLSVQQQQAVPMETQVQVAAPEQQQQIQATTGVPAQSVPTPMETQQAQQVQQQQIQPGTGVPAQSVPTPMETQQVQQQQIQPGTGVPPQQSVQQQIQATAGVPAQQPLEQQSQAKASPNLALVPAAADQGNKPTEKEIQDTSGCRGLNI
ncbi:unnamed protein product [Symbiodinium sp. CCMP2592]|nr:unnamed protein product [Symbiodinium sp. CCMP2592]